jgi:hypothetical protein
MEELPPDDLAIPDVLTDPETVRDVLRFFHQLKNAQFLINSGTRTFTRSENSRNLVCDLRETPEEPEIEEEEEA